MMPGLPARGSKGGYDLLITQRSCPRLSLFEICRPSTYSLRDSEG